MRILKTSKDRFKNLPDYNFPENYCGIDYQENILQMHYIDISGSADRVFFLLHGEPSWSYLYRHMIPILAKSKCRIIAPDLIGFGKSDKLTNKDDYTYANHLNWINQLIMKLDLQNMVFLAQDWGSLIGLRQVATFPERFKGMVVSNGGLPIGTGSTPGFKQWLNFSQTVEDFNSGKIVNQGCLRNLSQAEIDAYNAPFPDESYKVGARVFPTLVPIEPDQDQVQENKDAWQELKKFNKPTITLFGDHDKAFLGQEKFFIDKIPGAKNMPHRIISAGHFSQEDQPELLSEALLSIN